MVKLRMGILKIMMEMKSARRITQEEAQ